MPRDKSVGAALVLTFFFGPFGMLYSVAWWAALLMMVGAFFAGLLTFFIFGVGAGVFWAASMVWGAVAASNKHSRYLAWLAAQPQTFLTQAPQVAADQLPSASPPPSNDKAHELEDGTVTAPLPQLSAATPAAVAQPAAGSESSPSNREEEALLGLKRLSELGLITEQEAAAKRAEILTRLFPVPPSGEATIASDHSTPDDVHLADDTAACDRTGELPTMTVAVEPSEDATEPMAAVAATTEVAGAGVAPPAASRRKWLVVGVVAALLAAVAVAGALLVLSSRHHARPTTPSPIGVLASPSPSTVPLSASRLVTVTVPVNALPTSQGIDGATQLYPATIAVRVPSRWAGRIGGYGVAGVVLIAPAGWYGSGGIGADGSESATMHATGTSAIRGQLTYEMDGAGPATYAAAAYFPWVRKGWSQWGYSGSSPSARGGLVEHFSSTHLARYTAASGPEVDHGLQVNGVARVVSGGDWSFDRLEVALPPTDRDLAAAILRYYVSPGMKANEGVPQTLNTYFDAINSQDYQSAWQMFSPRFQATTSLSQFADGLSTVTDSDPVVHYVRLVNATTAIAYVTFTSFQNSSQGPNGDSKDNWTLDYRMKRSGWQWLIDYAGPHNGSTHTSG